MATTTDIEAVEKRLWSSADNLRANSNYASNEYFMPIMGLIFLRHAYNRFLTAKKEIEASLPSRGGKTRDLTPKDFSGRGALFLRPEAQFDHLVELKDGEDRSAAVIAAMESIEADYETLNGVLPKTEYQKLDSEVMGDLIRTFNDPALQQADGDVFGRIYEYFLTRFAGLKAHDDGEFFTPQSIVQMLVNVIEPDHGRVLDPACGSGGMFVQSAHFTERAGEDPTKKTTFYGLEKNDTTIRLAKMNLAVHGLEGNIQKAISYYQDHKANLVGKTDFVMANPPFNVDEVDADKVKTDVRLPFGLPGVNKKGKVSNANYLWLSYFHSYLSDTGRAGVVMSSQASSAGRDEAKVRQKLVETGDVDVMMAVRGGFFYTRTVPCELWFFDRGKPEERRDKTLMLDARAVGQKMEGSRTVYEWTDEQLANLTAVVWLYRGETDRFLALVADHLAHAAAEAEATEEVLDALLGEAVALAETLQPFLDAQPDAGPHVEPSEAFVAARKAYEAAANAYLGAVNQAVGDWKSHGRDNEDLHAIAESFEPVREQTKVVAKQADALVRAAGQLVDACKKDLGAGKDARFNTTEVNRAVKALSAARGEAVAQVRRARYFVRQARWLQGRFPDAVLVDVPGLVKLVSRDEIEENDWSLTPGRYVGVAPPEVDEDFDFEEAMQEIHDHLSALNDEASSLAETIQSNLEAITAE
jgi:type I restriction enzyme M protein